MALSLQRLYDRGKNNFPDLPLAALRLRNDSTNAKPQAEVRKGLNQLNAGAKSARGRAWSRGRISHKKEILGNSRQNCHDAVRREDPCRFLGRRSCHNETRAEIRT